MLLSMRFQTNSCVLWACALAQDWKPYLMHCIEAFGPERCMFESNFPVDKASCAYTSLWNAFKLVTRDFSPSDKVHLFHDTAARFYRIEEI